MRVILILLSVLLSTAPTMAEVARLGTFNHGGHVREHYLWVPPDVDAPPLVVALHGMGGNAKNLRFGIGLTERAARRGFAVVYPQGLRLDGGSRHWNAGFDYMDVDDTAYLSDLIRHLARTQGIDKSRVFVLGLSMGGYMAYHLACHAPVRPLAIASAAGRISGRDWRSCPAQDLPALLHIHGKDDPVIRYDSMEDWGETWGGAPSVPEIVTEWARRTNAAATPSKARKGLEELTFRNRQTGQQVRMIALEGFGHDWPSTANGGFSAVDAVTAFFADVLSADVLSTDVLARP